MIVFAIEAENCKVEEDITGWEWELFHSNFDMGKHPPGNYGTDYLKIVQIILYTYYIYI